MWQGRPLEQQISCFYVKKLAVIGNASESKTDSKEYLKKAFLDQKLETVKCITYNFKLYKGNEELSTLIDSGNKANLISRGYSG